jgi:transcriptional regulator with XRE-family HTH domain
VRLAQASISADRAGTSRTTISAYEHGRKSPTLATATRLLSSAEFEQTVDNELAVMKSFFAKERLMISVATSTVHSSSTVGQT